MLPTLMAEQSERQKNNYHKLLGHTIQIKFNMKGAIFFIFCFENRHLHFPTLDVKQD